MKLTKKAENLLSFEHVHDIITKWFTCYALRNRTQLSFCVIKVFPPFYRTENDVAKRKKCLPLCNIVCLFYHKFLFSDHLVPNKSVASKILLIMIINYGNVY